MIERAASVALYFAVSIKGQQKRGTFIAIL